MMVLYKIVDDRVYIFAEKFPNLIFLAVYLVIYIFNALLRLYLAILNQLLHVVDQLVYPVRHLI